MDPEIVKLRNNLNTFTLEELKKEVIKMKHLNFTVTRMKRNQVIQLIINYRVLFPHLINKTSTVLVPKDGLKRKRLNIPPARAHKITPWIISKIGQPS